MKIKVYIVSYKRKEILNTNLKSLWYCTKAPENLEVTVLSNYPEVVIAPENQRDNLKVVINSTRMPHAWGYLSRDWNYCIMDCFKTWQNPDNVDWCVLAQNDVTWVEEWDEWLKNNTKYDFISQPKGDQSMALNIEAVKKVGFFDERFTTLHFQEMDYFIRSAKQLKDRCSINDTHQPVNLSFNAVGNVITNTACLGRQEDQSLHNSKNHNPSLNYFIWKYGLCKYNNSVAIEIEDIIKGDFQKEVNWYPFFWDGFSSIEKTMLEFYNAPCKIVEKEMYEKLGNKTSGISVVVQGAVDPIHTPICLKSIRKYFPDSPIILSTWVGTDVSDLDFDKVVFNKDPGGTKYNNKMFNNVNRQIVSTYNGLKAVQTPYVIKIRSDMAILSNKFIKYFDKFPQRSEQYKVFENRIITYCFTAKFISGTEVTPFSISDWFYFGKTSDLTKLFDIPLNPDEDDLYFEKGFPENAVSQKGWFFRTPLRYHPEQYIGYTKLSQEHPETGFDHRFCNDDRIVDISNHFIANNFIMLNHFQLPLYLLKKDTCEYFGYEYFYWKNAITFFKWEKLYKKYCDKNHKQQSVKNLIHKAVIKFIYKNKKVQHSLREKYKKKIKRLIDEK